MGCVSSKAAAPTTPNFQSSGNLMGSSGEILAGPLWNRVHVERSESGESGKVSSAGTGSQTFLLGPINVSRYVEGEQAAAGWPWWISAVAAEAVHGMVPLRAESFERLEKIGQGTYSSVFKARDLETGKIVALKKVRFDNYEPESVRFMAREILILRRLNHPNIVKLEGIITARISCSIYLVFEYMEHDLAGLSSSPDIKFSESQVKCYMHQLLSGLEHCHSHGVMHRDIKCSNLLVNNEGILKMADFGLANFFKPGQNQPLTSRVVTLWYRPPELLLGSTEYEATVDLWSVGCVFAELFLGKPILQGRTEVEQIHKIFKLCGSPSDEHWRKVKLPHATVFKSQHPYVNCLPEAFNFLPENTFKMLETFLSLEPYKRGTAKSALASEYFKSKPYACEPSSLPKYSPHKEIDTKNREKAHRLTIGNRERGSEVSKRPPRTYRSGQLNDPSKLAVRQEESRIKYYSINENGTKQESYKENGERRLFVDLHQKPTLDHSNEIEGYPFSGPLSLANSSGLFWARKPKDDHHSSRSCAVDSSSILQPKNTLELSARLNEDSKGLNLCEMEKQAMLKQWIQFDHHNSVNGSAVYYHQDVNKEQCNRDIRSSKQLNVGSVYEGKADRVDFSGPSLSQPNKVDEFIEKHERHIRLGVRKSWFQRG